MSKKYAMVQCIMIRPELMGVSLSRWAIWAEENGLPMENTAKIFYGFQQAQPFIDSLHSHLEKRGYTPIINEIG